MIELLINLVIVAIIVSVFLWVLSVLPIVEPFKGIIRVVIIAIVAIWFILQLAGMLQTGDLGFPHYHYGSRL